MPNLVAGLQTALWNGYYSIGGWVSRVDHCKFGLTLGFRIVFGLVLAEVHRALPRKHVRQKLTKQKQNDSEVDHPDSNLLPGKLKASEVGRHEVNQQHPA